MTRTELATRARGAWAWLRAHPVLLLVVVAALIAFGVVRRCNRGSEAEVRAQAAEEREQARAAGIPTLFPVEDLRPELDKLKAENALLRAAYERAVRAVPGAKPAAVVRASTGPVAASGAPRPAEACPPPTPDGPPPACPACLLAPGDPTELRVDEVLLETRARAHLLVGTASAWRLKPEPAEVLAAGAFEVPTIVALEKAAPPPEPKRWGLGPVAGVAGSGAVYGAALATPSVRIPWVGWQLEGLAAGAFGPGGGVALASVLVRP